MICKATNRRGTKCNLPAVPGATVCRFHGGAAPQVLAAARQRLLAATDPLAARLIEIGKSKKTEDSDAIRAICAVLDRAGLGVAPVQPESSSNTNGLVLWEEFVAMYRRRVPGAAIEEGPL